MTERHMNRMKRRAAFTLLEIMLVIVIIGVIAAVAIGNLDPGATADHAKRTATATQIGGISVAVERYYMDVGKLPPSLDALVSNSGAKNWKGPYLKKIKPDAWGDTFTYAPGGGRAYEVRSNAGGSEGGAISSKDL